MTERTEEQQQRNAEADQGHPNPGDGGVTEEQANELIELVRSPDFEPPVGAEDLAEALRIVADQRDMHYTTLQRTAADYQNFRRRAAQNEHEARQLAAAGVVQSIVSVMDYFDLALKQNPETATVQQVIGGVEMIRSELLRLLGNHGVGIIEPGGGAEFNPRQHEAVEHEPAEGVEPGRVVACRSPGYTLGDRVIRPAKVAVAAETGTEGETHGGAAGSGDADEG